MHFITFSSLFILIIAVGSSPVETDKGMFKNTLHSMMQSLKNTAHNGLERVVEKLEEAETIAKKEFGAILERLEEEDPAALCCNGTNCENTSAIDQGEIHINKAIDCAQLYRQGNTKSGIYTIYPKPEFNIPSIKVLCDMETDGGGWIVFQRRDKYDRQVNFNRDWKEYENGFGILEKEFWLGNSQLHALTKQDRVTLRIDLEDFSGERTFAKYEKFHIGSSKEEYRLSLAQVTGPGDQFMETHNQRPFTTVDHNDGYYKCGNRMKGGWWYYDQQYCSYHYLNGMYENGSECEIYWNQWKNKVCLKKSEMKIRPESFGYAEED